MSIEPKDILATAQKLHEGGADTESDLRSAASRAYYAALHAAHLALPNDLTPSVSELRSDGSHEAIIRAVDVWAKAVRNGRNEAKLIERNLRSLKSIRKTADYELTGNFLISKSLRAITDAKEVLVDAARAKQKLAQNLNQ